MVKARPVRTAIMAVALLALGACTPMERSHGYAPTDDELAEITVGRDNRDTVARSLGKPSAGGLMADSGWFYVQSRWKHYGARAPREVDRQVVALSFDGNGTLSNVERFGLEDGQVVALSRRVTQEAVRGPGVLRRLFAGIGRIDPTQFLRRD